MKHLQALLCAIFLFPVSGLAQEPETTKIKRIKIAHFIISPGMHLYSPRPSNLQNFKKLAPESQLLNAPMLSGAQQQYSSSSSLPYFSTLLGFQFGNKEKTAYRKNPLLRVGVSYFAGSLLSYGYGNTETKPYDTLSSSQSGTQTFLDSVVSRSYSMSYRTQQVRVDASLIFRTNPDSRWSLFAGIGLTAGASINASTQISYYVSNSTSSGGYSDGYSYSGYQVYRNDRGGNGVEEQYTNASNFSASVFVPMGVDFRMGKKREFWKRLHLFYEARPGIDMTSIPELGQWFGGGIQQGIGLRVSWL